ncbi:MAG: hypothetical protein HN581_03910 [Porticoccaceae bacterium]|nr:hypothetical protein [Porticoccaceae bacterium]
MQALAEFIMRGRTQACAVALLGSFFPFVSPATIGLVTLRKGSVEGLLVLLWAALPLIASYSLSEGPALLTLVSIASLIMMVVSANVLRLTASWQSTMLISMLVGGLTALGTGWLFSTDVNLLVDSIGDMLAEVAAKQEAEQEPFIPGREFILGLIALILAVSALMSLFVARWWQALLYNPGGFAEEFHGLRLQPAVAGFLLLAVIGATRLPNGYEFWAELVAVPLLLAGLALVHHVVKFLQAGRQWLVFMYVGLIFFGSSVGVLLVGLGFADSVMNLRSRLAAVKNRQP